MMLSSGHKHQLISNIFLNFSCGRGDTPNLKMIFLLACMCWSLWLIHNDFVFNKVISNPNVVVHQ